MRCLRGVHKPAAKTAWTVLSRSTYRMLIVMVSLNIAMAAPRLGVPTLRHFYLAKTRHD